VDVHLKLSRLAAIEPWYTPAYLPQVNDILTQQGFWRQKATFVITAKNA
jgi:hypothetical protein